ncbi:hypothetical protein [Deminuibacter soli]|uniref:Transporter n=1 Tax=Deminuibacter soli TaxID=2291815 RepID=A0A3E1NDH6_9BACT|nr:hypothetical protein [Deminuibacter soli]RFM25922.1 hypothetical protein DXN05_22660 [Deminuibacter soli]
MKPKLLYCILLLLCSASCLQLQAQTDQDALMMDKNNLCIGPMYSHSSWKKYWEGTFKRDNQNLGTVTTQMVSIMGNYGITRRLNVMAGLPYIFTKASAGTLHGLHGLQDVNAWIKWMPVETSLGKGVFSVYTLGGFSLPASNYTPDFLPMSIGLHSKTLMARLMLDYQVGGFFVTGWGAMNWRSNIHLDRTSYYTTSLHLTNEVEMPDMAAFQLRTGYRSDYLIAEAIVSNNTTIKGFDMRKNDMPFPSNKMNMTTAGFNVKYTLKAVSGLSLIGAGNYVVHGRNVGQALTLDAGIFYIIDFTRKSKIVSSSKTNVP